jgi:hypothetical protein
VSSSSDRNANESAGPWAWFLPAAYAAHVIEEAFAGGGFMSWMYAGGGVRLSLTAFLGLNAAGVILLCLAAWAARRTKAYGWPLASGAAIVFVNGIWHAAICAMTRSYIPGVLTGLVVYIPVGVVVLFRMRRMLSPRLFASAIAVGFVIHGVVLWLVLRMPGFELG